MHDLLRADMHARKNELIELHRRLVQIPSVNRGDGSPARETEVAQFAADYLKPSQISTRIAESAPGRGNLLAECTLGAGTRPSSGGAADAKTLLLMSHSDVVPVGDETRWRFPPFSAEVADGRIWGRGSNDCKMLVAAELFVMKTLAGLFGANAAMPDLPRHGILRLAVGADEEAGGRFGFGWLAEHEASFLKADLAINEGGGAFVARGGGRSGQTAGRREVQNEDGKTNRGDAESLWFNLGCGEKGRYEVIVTAEGRGTHASIPWSARNPIALLATAIERLQRWEPPVSISGPTFAPLRALLRIEGKLTEANLEETIAAARERSRAFANSLLAQSRPTIAPTMMQSGEKSNAVPAAAELRCDARLLPGQRIDLFEQLLGDLLGELRGVEFRIESTAEPSESPTDAMTIALFERALDMTFATPETESEKGATAESSKQCRVLPNWCTGFTDSRFARSVGTPTYGFQVIEPNADPDRLSIHCIDESVEVGMLLPCAEALGHLALEFLADGAAGP